MPPRQSLLLPALLVAACGGEAPPPTSAEYVGAEACAECHAPETEAWRGSHHAMAMQPADSTTVRADFAGTSFTKDGVTTSFRHEDGRYLVRTDGPDGALQEFTVLWTFGVYPLQQFLIPFPKGRVQALNVVWDTRPAAEGGQRWFHLYGDDPVPHDDMLHWTGPLQNWNYMCADCHSTDLDKGWIASADSFATSFSELNVACEACHGPGSNHVAWARDPDDHADDAARGLTNPLHATPAGTWALAGGASIASRTTPLDPADRELDTCAFCHSRRARIWPEHSPGDPTGQWGRLALLDASLYEADGTQIEEVYKLGSFLQSRMHAAGVRCSDCHEPHSGRVRAEGNALCGQCHAPATYDVPEHLRHQPGSSGTTCIACHMPTRTYMGVDARHDHGFRVPRPDRSVALGTSNACTDCHSARTPEWAAAAVRTWYGPPDTSAGWPEALDRGRRGAPGAAGRLLAVARADSMPGIVRATAVSLLPLNPDPRSQGVVEAGVRDPDPLVRRAALEAMRGGDPNWRVLHAAPLLDDPIRDVRLAALTLLAGVPREAWSEARWERLQQVADEYRTSQGFNGDRAEALANLGGLEARLGNAGPAEAAFRGAIARWPAYEPGWAGLADLYRAMGQEVRADSVLRVAVDRLPEAASLHHALGLSLVRQGRTSEAIAELARGAELAPEVPRFAFVHAVALHDTGQPEAALRVLEEALERHPHDRDLLGARAAWGQL